jgi:hypothetical protein
MQHLAKFQTIYSASSSKLSLPLTPECRSLIRTPIIVTALGTKGLSKFHFIQTKFDRYLAKHEAERSRIEAYAQEMTVTEKTGAPKRPTLLAHKFTEDHAANGRTTLTRFHPKTR